jgi:hypothetical protein
MFHNLYGGAVMARTRSSGMFHNPTGGAMKRWLAVLGVLLAGALLLPQHAWSQGSVVNNGLQLQGTPLSIKFYDGTNTGTLLPATLTGNQTWTLPDASGTILLSSTIGTTAWLLTGNSGADPAVNFLGTSDAQPLVIRVGNQETFRFNPPGSSAPAWSIQRGGGNPRGLHSVDLKSARSEATQVASGDYSVIGGGQNNTARGDYATVGGGDGNNASNNFATVGGAIRTPPAATTPLCQVGTAILQMLTTISSSERV